MKVTGDLTDDQLETIQNLCEHSPVYGLMKESIPMKANIMRA